MNTCLNCKNNTSPLCPFPLTRKAGEGCQSAFIEKPANEVVRDGLDADAYSIDIIRRTLDLPPIDLAKYTPKKIISNYPATIVFWKDGTKTVVKCAAGTDPDLYNAFCAAVCKKIFGSNSHLKKVIEEAYNHKEAANGKFNKY